MQGPLDKVVFIQKVAAFSSRSLPNLIRLAYVNQSWADTIKNFSFHLFEEIDRQFSGCYFVFLCALKCNATWLVNAINFYILNHASNCLMLLFRYSSLEVAHILFDTIFEKGGGGGGGPDALKAALNVKNGHGQNSIMMLFYSCTSPPTVQFIMKKIVEVGGNDLLQNQLAHTDDEGFNTLSLVCRYSSSPQVAKLLMDTLVELGGTDLLRCQITWSRKRCIALACHNPGLSTPLLNLITDTMVAVGGGTDYLKKQLEQKSGEGRACLAILCTNANCSTDVLPLMLKKIIEVGGTTDFLQKQLVATDHSGKYSFTICCENNSARPIRFIASFLHHFDLFKQQYSNLLPYLKQKLKEEVHIIDATWKPNPDEAAEVRKMLSLSR